jgi:hypothetical protein
MRGFDIDHILVGPGGVFALEAKWSAEGWATTWARDRIDNAIAGARDNARHVRLLLRAEPHHMNISVQSIVVPWPSRSGDIRPMSEGVTFGSELQGSCVALQRAMLSPSEVRTAGDALMDFVRRRDDHEMARRKICGLRRWWYSARFDPLAKSARRYREGPRVPRSRMRGGS